MTQIDAVSTVTTRSGIWYALNTRPGRERVVAGVLETVLSRRTRGEAFRTEVPLDVSNGRKRVRWSGMVLVEVPNADEYEEVLANVPGVLGYVGGNPKPLTAEEVASLLVETTSTIDTKDINVGNTCTIREGAFAGLQMTVTAVMDQRIEGLVNLFGRETPVTVDRSQLD